MEYMEYIKKNIDPGYPSFYSDIWKSLDYESVVTFYTGGSDNIIYINDFTKSYTFELNEISLDSVKYVHTRNQKHAEYLMKRPIKECKLYLNSSTGKQNARGAYGNFIPESSCIHKDSTIDEENYDNSIQMERFNTDNISAMPALFNYTNEEFFFTDEFLNSLGISKDAGRKEFRKRSKRLFKFLEENIGNEELVAIRRTLLDNKFTYLFGALDFSFVSGSKAEGLDIKGSDTDHMSVLDYTDEIDGKLRVRDSFLFDSTSDTTSPGYISIRQVSEGIISDTVYSSSQFKLDQKNEFKYIVSSVIATYEHGPSISISNLGIEIDFVNCLKSEKWPRIAAEFTNRYRCFEWPSQELVNHITASGCHIVPKTSAENQNGHEWRLSFSQAENALIRSFNHTQLMTYGALKILFQEILNETRCDYDCAFASYILKTALFWICEDHELSVWQPSNIMLCITLCIEFLRKCVKTMNCPNFFVQTNNMNLDKYPKESIPDLLEILNVVSSNILRLIWHARAFSTLNKCQQNICGKEWEIAINTDAYRLAFLSNHKHFLLHEWKYLICNIDCQFSITDVRDMPMHKFLKKLILYPCYQLLKCSGTKTNKHDYVLNKFILKFILRGNKVDKIAAKLNLASWFYNYKRYDDCLQVLDVALKWISNSVYSFEFSSVFHNQSVTSKVILQSYGFRQIAKKFYLELYKVLPNSNCAIKEIKEYMNYSKFKSKAPLDNIGLFLHAETYSHFLRFLCYNKQKRIHERSISLSDLHHVQYFRQSVVYKYYKTWNMLLGNICQQLIEENNENIDFDQVHESLNTVFPLDILAEFAINTSQL
ncbi:Hypothetical predicted protein [Mytilus galloprovincialis]|uniref:Mab-21-like HhH/H2TH-like domain-containing protein n=1 Tax=Mytilus galloprovincialis TaxID=29158 RepID=A0A8B6GV22_MYTGA|nr:Hypothetical predicted protein [Mytilus galloprovincialis]